MSQSNADQVQSVTALTLEDLMQSESAVLRRINDDFQQDEGRTMAGHFSSTSGHNSSGQHASHTSAIGEDVLK